MASVNDDTTQRRTMSANELGGRMYHNISTMLDRTNQVGCAKGVVDNQGDVVLVGYSCQGVDIGDIAIGIAEGLSIDGLGVRTNGSLNSSEVVYLNNRISNALCSQSVGYQVERATIEIVSSYDMVASQNDVLKSVGNSCSTTGYGKTCHTSFQGSYTILEHALGRVGEASVDITCIAQTETVGCML